MDEHKALKWLSDDHLKYPHRTKIVIARERAIRKN